MRMIDPGLELVLCGSSGASMPTFGAWEATVLSEAYEYVDLISAHAYYAGRAAISPASSPAPWTWTTSSSPSWRPRTTSGRPRSKRSGSTSPSIALTAEHAGGDVPWCVFSTGGGGDGRVGFGSPQMRRSAGGQDWESIGQVWGAGNGPTWARNHVPDLDNYWAPKVY